jgi:hypothetical protein
MSLYVYIENLPSFRNHLGLGLIYFGSLLNVFLSCLSTRLAQHDQGSFWSCFALFWNKIKLFFGAREVEQLFNNMLHGHETKFSI